MTFRVSKLELFNDVRCSQRELFIHRDVVHLRTEELDLSLTLHTTSSHELEIFNGKIPLLVPLTLRYLLRTPILAECVELTPPGMGSSKYTIPGVSSLSVIIIVVLNVKRGQGGGEASRRPVVQ